MVKTHKVKKLALNLQLLTVQILTNDVQVLILCHFYFITTVTYIGNQVFDKKIMKTSIVVFFQFRVFLAFVITWTLLKYLRTRTLA